MPSSFAICLEDLNATDPDRRYLSCVALVGRVSGLIVEADGATQWKSPHNAGLELWVSQDDRLILYLPEDVPMEVTVSRSGRSLVVPHEKPVVLLDGDELTLPMAHLKVHIHGVAPAEHAPSWLKQSNDGPSRVMKAAATAALAVTTVLGGACTNNDGNQPKKTPIEVREHPPAVAIEPPPMKQPAKAPAQGDGPGQDQGEHDGSHEGRAPHRGADRAPLHFAPTGKPRKLIPPPNLRNRILPSTASPCTQRRYRCLFWG